MWQLNNDATARAKFKVYDVLSEGIGVSLQFGDIKEGDSFTLLLKNNENKSMQMQGQLRKHVKNNIALIDIDFGEDVRLNFDNVQVDLEYAAEDTPYLWRNTKLVPFQKNYVIQVAGEGVRHNRRGAYRVAVAKQGMMRSITGIKHVLVKDVSVTGFSITDRGKSLGLKKGDIVTLFFEDIDHKIDLDGIVVRIEERDDMLIYGFEILNICRDLDSYVAVKQRHNRRA